MTSIHALREFIGERLTVAAGEIFTVFEHIILQYEQEILRQRKLLEITWKPHIKLQRVELPQDRDCREEQLFNEEPNHCPEQEEPEPPETEDGQEEPELPQFNEDFEEPEPSQTDVEHQEFGLLHAEEAQEEPEPSPTEEHEEPGTGQEGERHMLFDSDVFKVPSIEEQSYPNEPEEEENTEQFLSQDSEVHVPKHWFDSESSVNPELDRTNIFDREFENGVPEAEKQPERPKYLCNTCGKSFTRKATLSVHMRTHTGEKPYSCETCGKSFCHKKSLLYHMRTHTSERPFACETCGKGFTQQSNLVAHRKTHAAQKLYSCEMCLKGFGRHDALSRHMKTHTGEKPYFCQMCGRTFSRQDSLLVHLRTHKEAKA